VVAVARPPACPRAFGGRWRGLVCFEAAELSWIGFQPLEAVFVAVGVIVVGLAWHLPRTRQ
jgi:hypothetical protein